MKIQPLDDKKRHRISLITLILSLVLGLGCLIGDFLYSYFNRIDVSSFAILDAVAGVLIIASVSLYFFRKKRLSYVFFALADIEMLIASVVELFIIEDRVMEPTHYPLYFSACFALFLALISILIPAVAARAKAFPDWVGLVYLLVEVLSVVVFSFVSILTLGFEFALFGLAFLSFSLLYLLGSLYSLDPTKTGTGAAN